MRLRYTKRYANWVDIQRIKLIEIRNTTTRTLKNFFFWIECSNASIRPNDATRGCYAWDLSPGTKRQVKKKKRKKTNFIFWTFFCVAGLEVEFI